ncbi:MAG: hypothetical protein LUQ44_03490 [Methanothrix sp.]|nr:hypothetical protein [Methanothrix sp.]
MNNFLKNIVARNLNQMDVIQPRLAGRFEPVPLLSMPVRDRVYLYDGLDKGDGWQTRDIKGSNHYPRDLETEVPGKKKSGLIFSTSAMEQEGLQHQSKPGFMDTRKSSHASGKEEGSLRQDIHADSIASTLPEETIFNRSSVRAPLRREKSQEILQPSEIMLEPVGEARDRLLSPKREIAPFAAAIKEDSYNEPVNLRERAGKGSDVLPPGEKASRIQEEEQISLMPEPEKSLKKGGILLSRIISREIEFMPLQPIEVDDTEKRMEVRIGWDSSEPAASIEPSVPPASPVLTRVRPRLKSYFEPKREEMPENTAIREVTQPVQVTIGRIEVKATNESAKPQRVRASPPVMSLDDYLKIKRGSL